MPETTKKREMVSPQVAADRLSVDKDTIFRWIKKGRLRGAVKLSPRIVRIPVSSIDALLAEGAL